LESVVGHGCRLGSKAGLSEGTWVAVWPLEIGRVKVYDVQPFTVWEDLRFDFEAAIVSI
jgi:hypothetical protein